jgi:serralysin
MKILSSLPCAILIALACGASSTKAAFHLWQIREAFTNADGSVQFVELFDSFPGEIFIGGFALTANSDGNIKTFTFPSNISSTPGAMLIATSGFGSLPGGVNPDFTFSQSDSPFSGPFFDPYATNISFTVNSSGDSMTFTGASLPKDGINSLTDAGAVGLPPGIPNISSGTNSPTNLSNQSGSVNLSPEPASAMLALAGILAMFGLRHR